MMQAGLRQASGALGLNSGTLADAAGNPAVLLATPSVGVGVNSRCG